MASLVFHYENEGLEGEELIKRTKELKPRFSDAKIRECSKIFRILANFVPKYKQQLPVLRYFYTFDDHAINSVKMGIIRITGDLLQKNSEVEEERSGCLVL